jgi:hypothetical protein
MTLGTLEEKRNGVFWWSMPRGKNWEDLLDSSSVCEETAYLNWVYRFSLE